MSRIMPLRPGCCLIEVKLCPIRASANTATDIAPIAAGVSTLSVRHHRIRLGGCNDTFELGLNILQCLLRFRLKTHHDHGCRIR